MFGHLAHVRRVATRYDKTALSFQSFVQLAASYAWLTSLSTEPVFLERTERTYEDQSSGGGR